MDIELVQKAGLTKPQATVYVTLVQSGPLTPAEIAERTGETRTNTYALLNNKAIILTEGSLDVINNI